MKDDDTTDAPTIIPEAAPRARSATLWRVTLVLDLDEWTDPTSTTPRVLRRPDAPIESARDRAHGALPMGWRVKDAAGLILAMGTIYVRRTVYGRELRDLLRTPLTEWAASELGAATIETLRGSPPKWGKE